MLKAKEVAYFREHQPRMDYRAGRRRANQLAAVRVRPLADKPNVDSNAPDSSGPSKATKLYSVWKCSGEMTAGIPYSLIQYSTLQKTEMHPKPSPSLIKR
jgi:hypothetical protein